MQERILQLYNLCKSNPKTSIGLLSTIICGLGIYKLRKIHHKFITYPGIRWHIQKWGEEAMHQTLRSSDTLETEI